MHILRSHKTPGVSKNVGVGGNGSKTAPVFVVLEGHPTFIFLRNVVHSYHVVLEACFNFVFGCVRSSRACPRLVPCTFCAWTILVPPGMVAFVCWWVNVQTQSGRVKAYAFLSIDLFWGGGGRSRKNCTLVSCMPAWSNHCGRDGASFMNM